MKEQKKLELDEMDAHCIARMLQSYLFTDTPFAGCRFCKYNCFNDDAKPTNDKRIRKLLMDFTGVDLGPAVYGYFYFEYYRRKQIIRVTKRTIHGKADPSKYTNSERIFNSS